MYYVTKKLQDFAMAHRLGNGYPGKCKNIHGHTYHLQVTLRSEILNGYGMVIDFGDIKKLFDTWVQKNWDHAIMVTEGDALKDWVVDNDQRCYVIPEGINSTAEYMSKFLFDKFTELLAMDYVSSDLALYEVRVWETEDSSAFYRKD